MSLEVRVYDAKTGKLKRIERSSDYRRVYTEAPRVIKGSKRKVGRP